MSDNKFETKVKEIFAQFEKDLNSENFKDFPDRFILLFFTEINYFSFW